MHCKIFQLDFINFIRIADAKSRSRYMTNYKANTVAATFIFAFPVFYMAIVNFYTDKLKIIISIGIIRWLLGTNSQ